MNNEDQDDDLASTEFAFQTAQDESLELPEADAKDLAEEVVYTRRSPALLALQERVVALVMGDEYKPVKPKAIARKLGLDSVATRAIKKAIRFLAQAGRVRYGANHVVFPPDKPKKDKAPD